MRIQTTQKIYITHSSREINFLHIQMIENIFLGFLTNQSLPYLDLFFLLEVLEEEYSLVFLISDF